MGYKSYRYAFNLLILTLFQLVLADISSIKVGVLIDYKAQITKAIRNETWQKVVEQINYITSDSITIETDLITDYEQFKSKVEDNLNHCEKYVAVITCLSCKKTLSFYDLIYEFCPSTLILSIHESNCERPSKDFGMGFPVMASVDDVIPMLIDMRHDFLKDWSHINILHDNALKVDSLHNLIDGLMSIKGPGIRPTQLTTFHFGPRTKSLSLKQSNSSSDNSLEQTDYHKIKSSTEVIFTEEQMAQLLEKDHDLQNFILIANSDSIKKLITKLHELKLLIYPRKWLIIYGDIQRDLNYWRYISPIFAATNTAVVQREISEYGSCDALKEGCQMKLAVDALSEALKIVSALKDYDFSNQKLKRVIKNRLLAEIRRIIGNDKKLSQYCGNCDRFILQAFERVSSSKIQKKIITPPSASHYFDYENDEDKDNHFRVTVTNTGKWAPFKGLLQEEETLAVSTGNLKGKEVRIGIINQKPNINVQIHGNKCIVNGTTPEMFAILSERMNFTIKWVCWPYVDDIGSLQKDNTWNGILGKLLKHEIEIVGNGAWKTPSRIESGHFEFLTPFSVDTVVLLVKKTPEDDHYLFLAPFTYDTWICILIAAISIGFILWKVHQASKYYDYYGFSESKAKFKLGDCILYCYGAMMQQSGDNLPKATSVRILIAFWWIFVIVTFTTYSGNLVALLTFPKTLQPVQNVQDLKNSWSMKWGVASASEIAEMVEHAKSGNLALLKKEMLYYNFEEQKKEIYDGITDGSLGYLMRQYEARYWISNEYSHSKFCGMHMTNDAVFRSPIHLVIKKQSFPSSVIDRFNREIRIITWSGLVAYWERWYGTSPNACTHVLIIHAGGVKKIDFIHMTGAFLVLACIIGISIVALLGEVAYVKLCNAKKDKDEAISTWNKISGLYKRISSGMLYTNSSPFTEEPAMDGYSKMTKLSFIHPQITADTSGLKKRWKDENRPRAYPFMPDIYGAVYGNYAKPMYNNQDNYYSY